LLQVCNMKKNIDKYISVSKLPTNAMTVSDYAKSKGYTTNYIYNQLLKARTAGKDAPFKIVVFQSFNFIIP